MYDRIEMLKKGGAMKKLFIVALVAGVLLLAGCSKYNTYPAIHIHRTSHKYDTFRFPLRDGYVFAEQAYNVMETEDGYDFIIHCVKGER